MERLNVQITWIHQDLKETSTFRYGMPFEYYESLAIGGLGLFATKHGVLEKEIKVEILVKYRKI